MTLLDYHRLLREERDSWDLSALESSAKRQDAAFPERVRRLLTVEDERFTDNLVMIERGPLFEKLAALCHLYLESTREQRTYVRSQIDPKTGSRLQSFGLRAATLGVRENTAEMVRLGLVGFAIGDIGTDVRETLMSISVMFHCANRVGLRAADLFREAAALCGPGMAAVMLDYIDRPPHLQTIGSMGWREVETPAGIGFRWGTSKRNTPAEPSTS